MLDISIWALAISLLGGLAVGAVAGLLPGVHVNNTSALLLGLAPSLAAAGLPPLYVAAMIVASTVAQSFLDIVPSVFLGAPEEATALAVMPGHRLLLDGRGLEAVRLAALGSALAIPVSLLLLLPLALFIRAAYPHMSAHMALILGCIAAYIVLAGRPAPAFPSIPERLAAVGWAAAIFGAAGCLGLAAFAIEPLLQPLVAIEEPTALLPLLSGLFGAPLLLASLWSGATVPRQGHHDFSLGAGPISTAAVAGTFAGALVSWFPAVSSGVATAITGAFLRKDDDTGRRYLITVSGVNTANAIFSLVALYFIGRPRSGAVAAAQELLGGSIGTDAFALFLAVIAGAGAASYLLTLAICSPAAGLLAKIEGRLLNWSVLLFLAGLCLALTGAAGLAIFAAAASIGLAAHLARVRKTCLMGVLLVPCILYFL